MKWTHRGEPGCKTNLNAPKFPNRCRVGSSRAQPDKWGSTLVMLMTLNGFCGKDFCYELKTQKNGMLGSSCFNPTSARMDHPQARQSIIFFLSIRWEVTVSLKHRKRCFPCGAPKPWGHFCWTLHSTRKTHLSSSNVKFKTTTRKWIIMLLNN